MGAVAAIGLGLQLYSGVKSQRSMKKAGREQAMYETISAEAEAALLEERAEDQIAISEKEAFDTRRQGEYVKSRAKAVAAASGGTASDKTALNVMADIEAETEYQALTHLYNGQLSSRDLKRQAQVRRQGGKFAAASAISRSKAESKAARNEMYGSLLSQGSSLYGSYS